jgi:hypothetical protein
MAGSQLHEVLWGVVAPAELLEALTDAPSAVGTINSEASVMAEDRVAASTITPSSTASSSDSVCGVGDVLAVDADKIADPDAGEDGVLSSSSSSSGPSTSSI